MAILTIARSREQRSHSGSPRAPPGRMRKFLVIAVLVGLGWLFVVQKRNEKPKRVATETKAAAQTATKSTVASVSPRPVSEHNWMKHSLDRANQVKQQVVQQRKADGTR